MDSSEIFTRIFYIYILIFIGFVAAKFIGVKKEYFIKFLIYILLPVITFTGLYDTDISAGLLYLPLIVVFICVTVATILKITTKKFLDGSSADVIAVGSANGNFGFLGIPLVSGIYGASALPYAVMINIGGALFISTFAIYLLQSDKGSIKDNILKVFKIPAIYAFLLGITINLMNIDLPLAVEESLSSLSSTFTVLGLALVGIAIAELDWRGGIKKRYLGISILGKFVLWPLMAFLTMIIMRYLFGVENESLYQALIVMSFVPVGATLVALATEFKSDTNTAGFIVVSTTFLSLLSYPVVVWLL